MMRLTSKNKLAIKDVLKRTAALIDNEVGYLNIESETDRRIARLVISGITREFAYEVCDSYDERKEFLKGQ